MILYYLLVSVMPMMRHPIWNNFIGALTVVKYLGGACLAYAIYYWIVVRRGGKVQFLSAPPAVMFLVFAFFATASSFFMGAVFDLTAAPIQGLLSFLLLFVITAIVVDSVDRVRWVALTAVGSIALAAVYLCRDWQKFHNVYADFRPKDGAVGDPNYFTLSALLCLPIAFYLVLSNRPRWERWFCFFCLVVSMAGITVAASRGGFLGLIPVVLVIFLHASRQMRVRMVMIVLLLALVAAVFPGSPLQRLVHPQRTDDKARNIRLALWRAGLRMMVAHPVTGIGLGNFKPMAHLYQDKDRDWPLGNIAHNTYVEVGAELGLPMLFLFLAIIFGCYRTAGRVFRDAQRLQIPVLPEVARGVQAGMMGYSVAAFFISAHFQKLLWEMVFLTCAMAALVQTYAAARKQDTTAPEAEKLLPEPAPEEAALLPVAASSSSRHWSIERGSPPDDHRQADAKRLAALSQFLRL